MLQIRSKVRSESLFSGVNTVSMSVLHQINIMKPHSEVFLGITLNHKLYSFPIQ